MRFFLFLLVLVFAGCTTAEAPFIKNLGAQEFAQLIQRDEVFVIDTHTPEQEHIKGTHAFVAFDALEENVDALPSDKDAPLAVYCKGGSMSANAAQTLQELGYTKIYNLEGGTNAWKDAGLDFQAAPLPTSGVIENDVTVFKSANCGCCTIYTNYLKKQGFNVKTELTEDTWPIKQKAGVPSTMGSCHTSMIGDYFVEGHVPVEAVHKLLRGRPNIKGITLPDMPSGSPGMPGRKEGPFQVYAVPENGQPFLFMSV